MGMDCDDDVAWGRRWATKGGQPIRDGPTVSIAEQFRTACIDGAHPDLASIEFLPTLLARACAQVLHVDGAGISVFSNDFRVPLGASNQDAATAERLQFSLGEGPCLDAYHSGEPFRGGQEHIKRKWPIFHDELVRQTPYRAIVSLPLQLSRSTGGAVDLYQREPESVDDLDLTDMTVIMGRIVAALSWETTPKAADVPGPGWLHGPTAQRRTRVWVAIGMINKTFDLPTADALARLRAYAYARDQTVDDVAGGLLRGTVPLGDLQP
jgi:hypothetical protein